MRMILNKGHRIRASNKNLVYHFSIGTLLFVFVAVLLLLNIKQLMRTDWEHVRFVDEEPDKRKNDWKLNDRWAWFIGDNRQSLKLTTKPEPYTLDRTLRWVQRQVAPTLKMLKKIDKGNGTDYMETIEQQAKLTEKHEMIIKQQTTPAKDLVES